MASPDIPDRRRLLDGLADAALSAGTEINRIFDAGFAVEQKADASPVTIADRTAEGVILRALATLAPNIPVVAEEEASEGRIPAVEDIFFLVDALDGTREFVKRGSDFTVNIALVQAGRPTLGVVYAPRLDRLFAGDQAAGVAWRREAAADTVHPMRIRPCASPPVAVASRSHSTPPIDAYLEAVGVTERVSIGSSLKFCLLAAGEADLYPRPSPTMEWDTAAGHAVLAAAGGRVLDIEGRPLRYGKTGFFNPGFLALGDFDGPPIGTFMAQ